MEQSSIALWVPQVQEQIQEKPDFGWAVLTREQRVSLSIATLSDFEYHMERLAAANPDLEIKVFDDVQNRELLIKWRRRRNADHR